MTTTEQSKVWSFELWADEVEVVGQALLFAHAHAAESFKDVPPGSFVDLYNKLQRAK